MSLEWIREALEGAGEGEALLEGERRVTYPELLGEIARLRARLREWGVRPGDVLAFAGDYGTPNVVRFFAALLEELVAVPLAMAGEAELQRALDAVPGDWFFPATAPLDEPPRRRQPPGERRDHPLLAQLRARGHAGVIVLTSGSTGRPKVILHDAVGLFDKFRKPRRAYRSLVFLLPDHMGGINTLVSLLTAGGTLILPVKRDPETLCALIARHRAELLPVTPSFLNLLLVSEAWRRHDLSSLKVVSYGTEVMPETTLQRAAAALPGVRFVQLYGSSELGIFQGRSSGELSPFLQLQAAGVEFTVREGTLWVRGADSMLGYLGGEPSGFGDGGWYDTGDLVEERDGQLRFLGRRSELINVGGQKVLPGEVEEALLQLPGVVEATVHGEAHALTGQIVVARVQLATDEDEKAFKLRLRQALKGRLQPYKIPVKVTLVDSLVSSRLKKQRRAGP
ncbi:MAG: long-chain fatty acid--CoA ligase [Myxococcota bacterium]|jgi:acyl-CoA synthetase (AMP-forming)/AMP-acid ligase II|nr:long-chain fatty acid--CoA ligase [Myxococcota bacterium]